MKCPHCKKEINKVQETLKIKELGLEITKPSEGNITFAEAEKRKPRGWDIPTMQQGADIINNKKASEFIEVWDGKHDFFVKQPINKNKEKGYVARWYAYSGRAYLGCYCDALGSDPDLRVIYVRELPKKKTRNSRRRPKK